MSDLPLMNGSGQRHPRNSELAWHVLFLVASQQVRSLRELNARYRHDSTLLKELHGAIYRLVRLKLLEEGGGTEPALSLTEHCRELIDTLDINPARIQQVNDPKAMVVKPLFGPVRPARESDCDLFVIMPFRQHLQHLYDDTFKATADDLGLTLGRGDDWQTEAFIFINIWSAIGNAKVVIAECTDNNPNVFYEIGLAHSLGKPVVLLTQDPENIPHDVRHVRHLVYINTPAGLRDLQAQLHDAIADLLPAEVS